MIDTSNATLEILKAIYILSFSLGLWTCANLLVSHRGDKRVKITIAGLILLLLASPINAYFTAVINKPLHALLVISQSLTWVYGPMLLFSIRNILNKKTSLTETTVHLFPFLVILSLRVLPINWPNFNAILFLLIIQTFGYTFYNLLIMRRSRAVLLKLKKEFRNSTYYWVLYLIAGLFCITLCDLYLLTNMQITGSLNMKVASLISCGFSIYVSCIALLALFQPMALFSIFPEKPTLEPVSIVKVGADFKKPRNIELSSNAAKELWEQLNIIVTMEKPHLDPDISLSKLASSLKISNHLLSELLNIHKSTTFYDFLNDKRFEESIKLILNTKSFYTITDIAFMSGFNNKNSFYKVFKKQTGMTPNEYRKEKCTNAIAS